MHNSCKDLTLSKSKYRKHERLNTDLNSLKTDQSQSSIVLQPPKSSQTNMDFYSSKKAPIYPRSKVDTKLKDDKEL